MVHAHGIASYLSTIAMGLSNAITNTRCITCAKITCEIEGRSVLDVIMKVKVFRWRLEADEKQGIGVTTNRKILVCLASN